MANILYSDYADWWRLLSDPADYAEEAEIYREAILAHTLTPPTTMLELGSGGGNNASHLKKHFKMTLVDLSPEMLRVSRELNPECSHIQGDMRTVRLGTEFETVFIHDAICYMATREDLRLAVQTAYVHCQPGGVALFAPDWTQEHFRPSSEHGGHDLGNRGLRYLEWTIDQDPRDERYSSYMVYLVKDGDEIRLSQVDEHILGLFPISVWLDIINQVGFQAHILPFEHSELEKGSHWMFFGIKPEGPSTTGG